MTENPKFQGAWSRDDVAAVIRAMPEDDLQRLHISLAIFIHISFSLGQPLPVVIRNVLATWEAMGAKAGGDPQP